MTQQEQKVQLLLDHDTELAVVFDPGKLKKLGCHIAAPVLLHLLAKYENTSLVKF
jgi:hypothetical protein